MKIFFETLATFLKAIRNRLTAHFLYIFHGLIIPVLKVFLLVNLTSLAKTDDRVKAVLVYGANGSFSAGNDIASFLNNEPPSPEIMSEILWDNATFDKPVIYFV